MNEDEGNEFEFWPNQLIALNADIEFIKEIYNGYLEKGSMDFRNPDEHTENFLFQVQGIVNLGMTNFDGFAVQLIIDNEDTLHVGTGDNKNDDFQEFKVVGWQTGQDINKIIREYGKEKVTG